MQDISYRSSINAIRGLAALIVVAYHYHYYSDFPWRDQLPCFRLGFIGVDIFFMLSGLIIAHVYLKDFRTFSYLRYWKYISRRIARIFPVHAIVLIAMLALPLIYNKSFKVGPISYYGISDWFQQLSMLRIWFDSDKLTWNSPAWTISAEMFAYIFLFPPHAIIIRNDQNGRKAAFLFIFSLLGIIIIVELFGTLNLILRGGWLLRIFFEFAIGVGLYGCLLKFNSGCKYWNYVATIGFISFFLMAINYQSILTSKIPLVNDSLFIISSIFIIAGAYNASGRLSYIMASRPLFFLGEISYSIYICHIPVFRAAKELVDQFGLGERGIIFCLMTTFFVVGFATFVHRWIELPARVALRRKLECAGKRILS